MPASCSHPPRRQRRSRRHLRNARGGTPSRSGEGRRDRDRGRRRRHHRASARGSPPYRRRRCRAAQGAHHKAAQSRNGGDAGDGRDRLQAAPARRLHRSRAARTSAPPKAASMPPVSARRCARRSANSPAPAFASRCSLPPSRRRSKPRAAIGAPVIEIHTGAWCDALGGGRAAARPTPNSSASARRGAGERTPASKSMPATASIIVTAEKIAALAEIVELNIGHFLIGEAMFDGLGAAVRSDARGDGSRPGARRARRRHDPRHRLRYLPTCAASPR